MPDLDHNLHVLSAQYRSPLLPLGFIRSSLFVSANIVPFSVSRKIKSLKNEASALLAYNHRSFKELVKRLCRICFRPSAHSSAVCLQEPPQPLSNAGKIHVLTCTIIHSSFCKGHAKRVKISQYSVKIILSVYVQKLHRYSSTLRGSDCNSIMQITILPLTFGVLTEKAEPALL